MKKYFLLFINGKVNVVVSQVLTLYEKARVFSRDYPLMTFGVRWYLVGDVNKKNKRTSLRFYGPAGSMTAWKLMCQWHMVRDEYGVTCITMGYN